MLTLDNAPHIKIKLFLILSFDLCSNLSKVAISPSLMVLLMLIDADLCPLLLIDCDWLVLMLIDADFCRFWLIPIADADADATDVSNSVLETIADICVLAGGGIVDYWAPLYHSEGPFQASMVMVKYLDLKLDGLTERDYGEFFLSYDNMHFGVTTCEFQVLEYPIPPLCWKSQKIRTPPVKWIHPSLRQGLILHPALRRMRVLLIILITFN